MSTNDQPTHNIDRNNSDGRCSYSRRAAPTVSYKEDDEGVYNCECGCPGRCDDLIHFIFFPDGSLRRSLKDIKNGQVSS